MNDDDDGVRMFLYSQQWRLSCGPLAVFGREMHTNVTRLNLSIYADLVVVRLLVGARFRHVQLHKYIALLCTKPLLGFSLLCGRGNVRRLYEVLLLLLLRINLQI